MTMFGGTQDTKNAASQDALILQWLRETSAGWAAFTEEEAQRLWDSLAEGAKAQYRADYEAYQEQPFGSIPQEDVPVVQWLVKTDSQWATMTGDGVLKTWTALPEQYKDYLRGLFASTASPDVLPSAVPQEVIPMSQLPRTVTGPNGEAVPINWSANVVYRDAKGKRWLLYLPNIPANVLNDYTFKAVMEQAYGNKWEDWGNSTEDSESKTPLTFTNLLQAAYYSAAANEAALQGITPNNLPPEVLQWSLGKATNGQELFGGLANILSRQQKVYQQGLTGQQTPRETVPSQVRYPEPMESPYLSPVVKEAIYRAKIASGDVNKMGQSYQSDIAAMQKAMETGTSIQLTSGNWFNPREALIQITPDIKENYGITGPGDYPYQGGTLRVYAGGQAYFIPTQQQWAGQIVALLGGKGQLNTLGPFPKSMFKGMEIPYSDILKGHLIEGPDNFYVPNEGYQLTPAEIEAIQKSPLSDIEKTTYGGGLQAGKLSGYFDQKTGKWVNTGQAPGQTPQKTPEQLAQENEWKRLTEMARQQSAGPTRVSRF